MCALHPHWAERLTGLLHTSQCALASHACSTCRLQLPRLLVRPAAWLAALAQTCPPRTVLLGTLRAMKTRMQQYGGRRQCGWTSRGERQSLTGL